MSGHARPGDRPPLFLQWTSAPIALRKACSVFSMKTRKREKWTMPLMSVSTVLDLPAGAVLVHGTSLTRMGAPIVLLSSAMPYVLALDQGTTSSRAIVFDERGAVVGVGPAGIPADLSRSPAGWSTTPQEIWRLAARRGARGARSAPGSPPRDIAAIGITNQRETTVVWDRATGEPVANAIVWQDRRTADFCDELQRDGHEPTLPRADRPACSTPTSPAPSSPGCSTTSPARARAPSAASSPSAPSTPG